jgi:hypothetical protein
MSQDLNRSPVPSAGNNAAALVDGYESMVMIRPRSRLRRVLKWTTRAVLLGAIVTATCAAPTVVDRYQEARETGH